MKRLGVRGVMPLLLAGLMLTRCSCDFFGTTGALLISENDEMRLGRQFDSTLHATDSARKEYPVYVVNPNVAAQVAFDAYVKNLGQELVNAVPKDDRPAYPFTFTIIDKNVENAFAVPGGYVYIYTGIIRKMQDESELAGVLGHEIAHVTRHHYRDKLAREAGFSLLIQALLGNDAGKLAQLVAGSFFQLASLSVSRDKEKDADDYGTQYLGGVRRNPLGIAKLFSRFDNAGPPAWLLTHPPPENRVQSVTQEVNDDPVLKALAADSATNFKDRFRQMTQVIR